GLAHVLSELETEHQKVETEYTRQLTLHTTLSQLGKQLAKAIEDIESQTIQNFKKLNDLDQTWAEFKVSANCNAQPIEDRTSWLQEQLKTQRLRQQQLLVEIQSYAKQKEQLEVHKSKVLSLEKEFGQIQNKIKDTDRTLKSLETQNKSVTIEREKDQKELEELRQALTTYFSSEQWFENWQSDPVSFVSRIKEFAKSWKDNIAELDLLLQKQGVQTEKRNGLEVQLNTTKEEVRLAQKKLSDLKVENKALTEKRTVIFDGAEVTEVEAKLNVAIELAKEALDNQRLNVEKLQGALTRNIAQHEQL